MTGDVGVSGHEIPAPVWRRPTRVRVLVLTLLAAMLLAVAWSSRAAAGDYVVRYCQPGLSLQDWEPIRLAPGTLTEDCASGAGRIVADLAAANEPGHSSVAWSLSWPVGLRPVALRAQANRVLHGHADGGIAPYGLCAASSPDAACPSGQTTSIGIDQAVAEVDGNDDRRFWIGVTCGGVLFLSCDGASGSVAVMRLEVTWRDLIPPTGSATIATLASPSGLPVSGRHTVLYRASDSEGSGVLRVEARIDGAPVAVSPEQCAAPYVSMRACPADAIGQLEVDTAAVGDGTHRLEIVAIDVAGNERTVAIARILTQNGDTVGPGSDPALRGASNGDHAGDDARLNAWWPATAKSPSKNRRVRKRCRASAGYRRARPVTCRGRAPGRSLVARFSARRANTLRGRLLTPDGAPIVGASLKLVATPTASGAMADVTDTISTDATGRFTARVPAKSGSAGFAVQWHAKARDTIPVATVQLQRSVRAATSLSIRPRSSVARGQRLTFSGRLRGTAGNPKGTAVVIQANAGRVWRAVTTVRARASGRWSAAYRVPRQLRGSYRFRAVVKPSAAYPYATGRSPQRRVVVRAG